MGLAATMKMGGLRDPMTLLQKQQEFVLMISQLIQFAYQNDCRLTFGDAYRDPRVHGGFGERKNYSSPNSLHKVRLAIDFNLFRNGKYLTSSEAHKPLGVYWESIGGTWGGRFSSPDGNHYSMEWNGYK